MSAPTPPARTPLSPTVFAHIQLSLLASEQASEIAETALLLSDSPPSVLARAGLAILNLALVSQRTGLGGRTVVELGLDPAVAAPAAAKGPGGGGGLGGTVGGGLPEHGIRTGDIVRVGEQPKGGARKKEVGEMKGRGVEGVVTRVGERAVWVAVGRDDDGDGELGEGRLWL
jgi:DNA polymerase alpha-associated DNA helicase A